MREYLVNFMIVISIEFKLILSIFEDKKVFKKNIIQYEIDYKRKNL